MSRIGNKSITGCGAKETTIEKNEQVIKEVSSTIEAEGMNGHGIHES